MDTICQSGACPHFTSSVAEGLRSPSPSFCSEPIFPSPTFKQSSIFSVLQLKSPRTQVFNNTTKKAEKISRQKLVIKELYDSKNLRNVAAFPVVPDTGGSSRTRDRKHVGRYSVPELKTTPFHYPFQYPHLESWRQIAHFQSQRHNRPKDQKQEKQTEPLGFRAEEHRESKHRKHISHSKTILKHQPQKHDLPSLTLLKPKFFDGQTAIMQKPGKLWQKETGIKQKLLGRMKRKRTKRKTNLLHKTELCVHWTLTSICKFRDRCNFAHGIHELKNRVRPSNFKTRLCADCALKDHKCFYGPRCNFCHPGEAIRREVDSAYFDREYYKDLENDFRDNEYPFGIFV
jgi:hypothetical protein